MATFSGTSWRNLIDVLRSRDSDRGSRHDVVRIFPPDGEAPVTAITTDGKILLRVRGAGNGVHNPTAIPGDVARDHGFSRPKQDNILELAEGRAIVNGHSVVPAPDGVETAFHHVIAGALRDRRDPVHVNPGRLARILAAFDREGIESVSIFPSESGKDAIYIRPTTGSDRPDIDALVMPIAPEGEAATPRVPADPR